MDSFEGSPHTYVSDSQDMPLIRKDYRYIEKLKTELTHEKEYLQAQSADLQHKTNQLAIQKEVLDQSFKNQRDSLRKKELDFLKKEAEFYKIYETFCNEKDKWTQVLDLQLEDIENRELELEAQREELATELEKCQILGENLHKIQSEIKAKSLLVNEKEKILRIQEERVLMKTEDMAGREIALSDKEKRVKEFEGNLSRIVQDVENKQEDIEKTSEMFEWINENLLSREDKLKKEVCAVSGEKKKIERENRLIQQRTEELEKWEKEIKYKLMSLQGLEEGLMSKFKVVEQFDLQKNVTTEEDEECCVIGINVLTPRSNESNIS